MSPLSGVQVLDRLGPAVTSGIPMSTATHSSAPAIGEFDVLEHGFALIQADESTYLHSGRDWSTRVVACKIRLGVAAVVLVGIPHVESLVRTVLTGGWWTA